MATFLVNQQNGLLVILIRLFALTSRLMREVNLDAMVLVDPRGLLVSAAVTVAEVLF
jgi:hypothetical protein